MFFFCMCLYIIPYMIPNLFNIHATGSDAFPLLGNDTINESGNISSVVCIDTLYFFRWRRLRSQRLQLQKDVPHLWDVCHLLVPSTLCSWRLLPFGRFVLLCHQLETVSFSSTCSMLMCHGVFSIFGFPNLISHKISCILYQLCYRQNIVWTFKTGQFQTKSISNSVK